MQSSWQHSRRMFRAAAECFVALAPAAVGHWDDPGLGEWSIRSLVGHTSRALLTVEAYLKRPTDQATVASPAQYFRALRMPVAGAAVADRGHSAGHALGEDPPAKVAEIAERVLGIVEACTGEELVATPAGGMRLSDYLPTRTFELVVHTADLGAALKVPAGIPPEAACHALELVAELAAGDGKAVALLFAATGRTPLPAGFTLL